MTAYISGDFGGCGNNRIITLKIVANTDGYTLSTWSFMIFTERDDVTFLDYTPGTYVENGVSDVWPYPSTNINPTHTATISSFTATTTTDKIPIGYAVEIGTVRYTINCPNTYNTSDEEQDYYRTWSGIIRAMDNSANNQYVTYSPMKFISSPFQTPSNFYQIWNIKRPISMVGLTSLVELNFDTPLSINVDDTYFSGTSITLDFSNTKQEYEISMEYNNNNFAVSFNLQTTIKSIIFTLNANESLLIREVLQNEFDDNTIGYVHNEFASDILDFDGTSSAYKTKNTYIKNDITDTFTEKIVVSIGTDTFTINTLQIYIEQNIVGIDFEIFGSDSIGYTDQDLNTFSILPNIVSASSYPRLAYNLVFTINPSYNNSFYIDDEYTPLSANNTLPIDRLSIRTVILKIDVNDSNGITIKNNVSFKIEDVKLYSPRVFNNDWQHTISHPSSSFSNNLWNIEPLLPKSIADLSANLLTCTAIPVEIKFTSIGSGTHIMYIDDDAVYPSSDLTITISLNNENKTKFSIYTKTTSAFTLKITIPHNFTLELADNIYRGSFLNRLNDLFTELSAPATITIESTQNIQSVGNNANIHGTYNVEDGVEIDVFAKKNPVIELNCDLVRDDGVDVFSTKINLTLDFNLDYVLTTTEIINQPIVTTVQIVALQFKKVTDDDNTFLNPFIIHGVDFDDVDIYIDEILHESNETFFHSNKNKYKIIILNKNAVSTNVQIDCSENLSVFIHDDMYGVQLPNSINLITNTITNMNTTEVKIQARYAEGSDNFGLSVAISGNYAIVGARSEDTGGSNAGAAYIFKHDGSSWTQEAKIVASDPEDNDEFGCSVAISGDYAVVGAQYEDTGGSNAGAAYIFKREGISWPEQAKIVASDAEARDLFGCSVAISGDYVIVGARSEDTGGSNAGAAYIFKREGILWPEQPILRASDAEASDSFGNSVAISGDYAIVGARYEDTGGSNAGAAYIFKYNGTSWVEQVKLMASDAEAYDYFGWSVAISGDYVIVGARSEDTGGTNAGAAYIFKRTGISWGRAQKIQASDVEYNDTFGISVAISGDYAIVGARLEDTGGPNAGAAYIFKRTGTSWGRVQKIQASDVEGGDFFGCSVAISEGGYAGLGFKLIVGAQGEDTGGSNAGSAYIYSSIPGILPVSGISYNINDINNTSNFTFKIPEKSIFRASSDSGSETSNVLVTFTHSGTTDKYYIYIKLIIEAHVPTIITHESPYFARFFRNYTESISANNEYRIFGFGEYMYYSYSFLKPPIENHDMIFTLNLNDDDNMDDFTVNGSKPFNLTNKNVIITNIEDTVIVEIKTSDPIIPFDTSFNYQWKYATTAKTLGAVTTDPLNLLIDEMNFFSALLSDSSTYTVAIHTLELNESTSNSTFSFDTGKGLVYRTSASSETFTLTATYTIRTTIDTEYENNNIAIDIDFTIPEHEPGEYFIDLLETDILTVTKNGDLPPNFYQAWKIKKTISSENLVLKVSLTFNNSVSYWNDSNEYILSIDTPPVSETTTIYLRFHNELNSHLLATYDPTIGFVLQTKIVLIRFTLNANQYRFSIRDLLLAEFDDDSIAYTHDSMTNTNTNIGYYENTTFYQRLNFYRTDTTDVIDSFDHEIKVSGKLIPRLTIILRGMIPSALTFHKKKINVDNNASGTSIVPNYYAAYDISPADQDARITFNFKELNTAKSDIFLNDNLVSSPVNELDYSGTSLKLVILFKTNDSHDIAVEIFRNPKIDDCRVFLRRTTSDQPTFDFINEKRSSENTSLSSTCASSGINHFIPRLSKDDYFDDDKLYFTLYFDYERQYLENDTSDYTDIQNTMDARYKAYAPNVILNVNGSEVIPTKNENTGEYYISRDNSTFWFATVKVQIFDDSPDSIFEVAKLSELSTTINFENNESFFQSENKQMNYIFNPSPYSLSFTLDNFFVPSKHTCNLRVYHTNSAGITSISNTSDLTDNTPVSFTSLTSPSPANVDSSSRLHVMLVYTASDGTVILANNNSSALVYVGLDEVVPRFNPILLNQYAPAIEIEAVIIDGLFQNYKIELNLQHKPVVTASVSTEHIYSIVEDAGARRITLKLPYAYYQTFFDNAIIGDNSLNIKFTCEYEFSNDTTKTIKTLTTNKSIDMNYDANSKTIMSCVIQ
jgi:hypothetical protein